MDSLYENFCAVISKWQSYIISKRIQNCAAHFERTVDISFQNDRDRCRSFRNESHISSRKDKQTIFQPGSCRLNLVRIQSTRTRNTPQACKRQFAFEISFRWDSHRAFLKEWGRCRLFRRDSHISFQKEHHFKITHFEGIIIYHF